MRTDFGAVGMVAVTQNQCELEHCNLLGFHQIRRVHLVSVGGTVAHTWC